MYIYIKLKISKSKSDCEDRIQNSDCLRVRRRWIGGHRNRWGEGNVVYLDWGGSTSVPLSNDTVFTELYV